MTEPLTPAQLAKLAVEVHPHLELMARAAPHMKAIESAAPILDKWPAIQADLNEALKAPEHLRPAFTKGLLDELARKHGITPELMGALALEMKARPGARPAPAGTAPRGVRHSAKRLSDEQRQAAYNLSRQAEKLLLQIPLSNSELVDRLEGLTSFRLSAPALSTFRSGRARKLLEGGGKSPVGLERLELLVTALELILGEQKRSAA